MKRGSKKKKGIVSPKTTQGGKKRAGKERSTNERWSRKLNERGKTL